MASTMASMRSWESSASWAWATRAARASVRASAIEARSRSDGGVAAGASAMRLWRGAPTEAGGGASPWRTTCRPGRPGAWENPLDFGVRTRDDVHRDQLADAAGGGGAGIGGGLDGADIAAGHDRDVPGPDVFLGDQLDVGGLHHRVGRFDGADEATGFDESEGVSHEIERTLACCSRGRNGLPLRVCRVPASAHRPVPIDSRSSEA